MAARKAIYRDIQVFFRKISRSVYYSFLGKEYDEAAEVFGGLTDFYYIIFLYMITLHGIIYWEKHYNHPN